MIDLNIYKLGKYKFEDDKDKAEKNLKKQKIEFEDDARISLDDYRFDEFDESRIYDLLEADELNKFPSYALDDEFDEFGEFRSDDYGHYDKIHRDDEFGEFHSDDKEKEKEKTYRVIDLNVYYELGDLKFEWDEDEAEKNLKKHKIAFEDAARIFLDDYRFDDYDEIHSDDEEKIKTVGFVMNVLAVIYTKRGDRNRIISARRANTKEERDYFGQFEQ